MSKTRLDWLELPSFSANPTDTDAGYRGLAAVGTSIKFWNGTAWVTLEEGTQGDFVAVVVTPTAATIGVDVVGAALTTGKGLDMSDLALLTTGIGVHVASSATAITTTGRLLLVDHTGATGTTATLVEFKSAANDETVIVQVTATAANALGVGLGVTTATTTGTGIKLIASALTTGAGIAVTSTGASQTSANVVSIIQSGVTTGFTGAVLAVTSSSTTGSGAAVLVTGVNTTTGDTVKVVNNDLVAGTSTLMNLSHTTSVLGAGNSMLRLTSTSIDTSTTTGTMLDIAATAATTGHLVIITSASLTTGIGIKFTLAGLTTGSAIDTTGIAATKQNFNMNSSTGSTAAPQTNAPTGFFKIGIGGTDQWVPYYSAS